METNQPQEKTPGVKKYVIKYLGENNVELPTNYSTDIEGEYKLINLINEPKENYKLAATNEYAKIYKRKVNIKKKALGKEKFLEKCLNKLMANIFSMKMLLTIAAQFIIQRCLKKSLKFIQLNIL